LIIKNFEQKKNKNTNYLPSARRMALGERGFAECRTQTLGEVYALPSATFAALGKG